MAPTETMLEALRLQATSCRSLGSPLYADVLTGLADDFERGGVTWRLLADRPERPVPDAIPLRLLGALHRVVLRGDAPDLAARYPSAGGDGAPVAIADVLRVLEAHEPEIARELGTGVQTNEVGRCAVLVVGFTDLARRWQLPMHVLEVGASAGLNLNWDRYWYDTGSSTLGGLSSPVRFDPATDPPVWAEAANPPDLTGPVSVRSRAGCDAAPLDVADADDRARLLSFVWPDQRSRFERLRAALEIAAQHRPPVDRADAGEWLADRLAAPVVDAATVVYHSIVWQYLGGATRERLREALRTAAEAATARAPLAWLRMEPAGSVADLRVTTWPGGEERVLAHAGYHGQGVRVVRPR
jgi:hypothetical protein